MEAKITSCYTEETLGYLLQKSAECSKDSGTRYLEQVQQGKITAKQRENLVDWVAEFCETQKISQKTCQMAIYLIDSFLRKKPISHFSLLELIGLICISISLKYEEGRELLPKEMHMLCEQRFSLEAIITTEVYVLSMLNWKVDFTTPIEILNYLFELTFEEFDKGKVSQCAQLFVSIALADYEISLHSPVEIAVSSVLCVFDKGNYAEFCDEWLNKLEKEFGVSRVACCQVMLLIQEKVKLLS